MSGAARRVTRPKLSSNRNRFTMRSMMTATSQAHDVKWTPIMRYGSLLLGMFLIASTRQGGSKYTPKQGAWSTIL